MRTARDHGPRASHGGISHTLTAVVDVFQEQREGIWCRQSRRGPTGESCSYVVAVLVCMTECQTSKNLVTGKGSTKGGTGSSLSRQKVTRNFDAPNASSVFSPMGWVSAAWQGDSTQNLQSYSFGQWYRSDHAVFWRLPSEPATKGERGETRPCIPT